MKKFLLALGLTLIAGVAAAANPQVVLDTSKGPITVELYPDAAPASVANFLQYVKDKHYDGTIFHRVVKDFVVQGGGMDASMKERPTRAPIKNEAAKAYKAGLKNDRGTLAMARTGDPDSATSQFYINLKNNDFLNYPSRDGYGYAVFGKVIKGMDVVDAIADAPTVPGDVPATPILIKSARTSGSK
ncbi:peptidylprolyl isomerase [Silvimonas iriomotensis]|uniref:Peptidyl-prolyl cis-trans isomerase n=1 Tax=Silvimonas iriomotensis TaxID=449662 RepID=A0ABQ2PA56_9NEIS|nr:peptidylprolyl isomerase [Silvimonas iriomotensis]GGP21671.1 peptidyl-prolyl cis-trans isomerase [Silvimonas iriomotensis]